MRGSTSERPRSGCGLREVVVKVASEALLLLFPEPFGFVSVDGLEVDSPQVVVTRGGLRAWHSSDFIILISF